MRKTFLNVLMLCALSLGVASTFVSCKDYDDDIAALQKQYGEQSSLLEAVEAKVNAAQNSIASLTASQQALEAALKTAKEECQKNCAQNGQAAKDYADAGDVATLNAAKAAINEAVAGLQAAIKSATQDLENGSIAKLVAADAALETKIVAAQSSADQALNLVNDLKGKVASIQTDLTKVTNNLTTVQKDLATIQSKVGTLTTQMADAQAEIAKLKTALAAQQAALESITGKPIEGVDLTDVNAKIEALKAEVAKQDGALKTALEAQIAKVAADLAAMDVTVKNLAGANAGNSDESTITVIKNNVTNIINKDLPSLTASITDIDVKYEVITKALSNKLRSLVLKPILYIDGIETIEYPYVRDTVLKKITILPYSRQRADETYAKDIADLTDYVLTTPVQVVGYNPVIGVDYHLNPSTADVKYSNVIGFTGHIAETGTRVADHSALKITSPEVYYDGCKTFKVAKGMVTAGMQVGEPEKLNHLLGGEGAPISSSANSGNGNPGSYNVNGSVESGTGHYSYGKDNVVALQIGSQLNGKDTVITSDYAMVLAEKMWIDGIIWNKALKHRTTTNDETQGHNGTAAVPNFCGKAHVYDTPQEALAVEAKDAVQLYYNSKDGINLEDYLGVHYVRESGKLASNRAPGTWAFTSDEMKHFGLTYEFELIDYKIAGNKTGDSRYLSLDNKVLAKGDDSFEVMSEKNRGAHGLIKAHDVNASGSTLTSATKATVDREPLVRVLLFLNGKIIQDGYILVHITEDIPEIPLTTKTVNYHTQDITFDLCNGNKAFRTNWSHFSYQILTQASVWGGDVVKDGLEKDMFDKYYAPDVEGMEDKIFDFTETTDKCLYDCAHENLKDDLKGGNRWLAAHYSNTPASAVATKSKYGTVRYYENGSAAGGSEDSDNHFVGIDGQENHTWSVEFSAEDLEELTHDGKNNAVYTTYVRYIKRTGVGAPADLPDFLYLGLTVNIARRNVPVWTLAEKNINYWYSATGDENGLDYVNANVDNPLDGQYTYIWSRQLLNNFLKNELKGIATAKRKFYFTPNDTQIKGADGNEYVITAKGNGINYDKLICLYDKRNVEYNGTLTSTLVVCKTHTYGTEEDNNKVINSCVIDWTKGAFANDKLYAYRKGTNTGYLIATLNQNTGELTLNHPDKRWNAATLTDDQKVTEAVVNGIGYAEKNANIANQLHKEIAVVAMEQCENAMQTKDARFNVSWDRPINLHPIQAQVVVDANTNANKIYMADILRLFDYRGPKTTSALRGDMNEPGTKWLWAYYDIHRIAIDCNPAKVTTTMHYGSEGNKETWKTLAEVNNNNKPGQQYLRLWADEIGTVSKNYDFDLSAFYGVNYDFQSKSNDLYELLKYRGELKTDYTAEQYAAREALGYIYYDNNGWNVSEFKVRVPISIHYEWGVLYSSVEILVKNTIGNP